MPVVVVATLTAKPDSVDTVREVLKKTVAAVHSEAGCEFYSLHEAGEKFIFVEQWADKAALDTHNTSPALTGMVKEIGAHLAGAPEITLCEPVPAGDPAKGQLVH